MYLYIGKCSLVSCSGCEWGEWTSVDSCSKPCGGGFRRVHRQIISDDAGCDLDGDGHESWRMEHCNDHLCELTIVAWALTPIVTLVVAGVAVSFYKRGSFKMQRDIPLRTYPGISQDQSSSYK